MKAIPLTKGFSACIDDIDYASVTAIGHWSYEAGYAVHYQTDEQGIRKRLWMHRLIMAQTLGHPIPAGMQVDHINANRLDNQRSNLRLATRSENQAAKGTQVNSSSGYKGVNWRKGKYEVRLRHYGKRLYLGRFASLEMAHAVYAFAHQLLWQEFSSETSGQMQLPAALKIKIDTKIAKLLKADPIAPPHRV